MKVLTIIKKEYIQIVKKKSFLFATIITPLIMAAFIFLPVLLTKVGREIKNIEILDYSEIVGQAFLEKTGLDNDGGKSLKLKFELNGKTDKTLLEKIKKYEISSSEKESGDFPLLPNLKEKILSKKIDGVLIIPDNIKENRRVYFCALNISDFRTNEYISSTIQEIISTQILTEQNIQLDVVAEAIRGVNLNTFKVKKKSTKQTSSGMDYMMSIFMLTILFTVLMAYGQLIMRGVIEEKNNRIVEVLISSTNAQNLFYGKIIGIGLAGLTQVSLWAILSAIFIGSSAFSITKDISGFLSFELGIYFVIFFTIGYFMYSVLFSIVGASVNTDQEAQQFAAPITYLLVVPFIIGIMVTQNPNTPFVIAASLFPLFTPTLMFMRISVAVPSFFQVLLSIILSSIFTFFLAWLGAKIFRIGILMYGKKPSVSEIMKWLRYK